ncbi:MAG: Hsp20/alpha crystallin family protein [Candidatus Thermoplasmatota archaeon]
MTNSSSPHKDVADLLENLARRIRNDPEWGAGQPGRVEQGGITIFTGDPTERPHLGEVGLIEDTDAITVTAETRNTDAHEVHVTLADDKLFIGLGEGPAALRKGVSLPCPVDEEAAVATFRNGILDIVLPLRKRS